MPTRHRALTRTAAAAVVADSFTPRPQPLYGIELEWPVHRTGDTTTRPTQAQLLAATAEPLPSGGRVSVEPGGQVELSTLPVGTVDDALDAATADATALHDRLARAGLITVDRAVDTRRAPLRILDAPRYRCMESFFRVGGDAGTWMMCNTASLQVNLGHDPVNPDRRWALTQRLGPVLVATFANSPGFDTGGRRWESLRQAIWWSIDPRRTRPPGTRGSASQTWLDYALAADVMLIRAGTDNDDNAVPIPPGFAFGRWLTAGHPAGWPTVEDLRYHLTTLFPPVRPRGWLELRMLDLLPPRLRDVATVVTVTALTTDAALELEERLPPTAELWCAAARHAMAHPVLAAAAQILFDAVLPAVGSVTTDAQRHHDIQAFAELNVARGLSPAQRIADSELDAPFWPALDLGDAAGSALAG